MTPHNQAPAHSFTYPFTPPPFSLGDNQLNSSLLQASFCLRTLWCFSLRESEALSPRSLYRWLLLVTLVHFLCPLYLKNTHKKTSRFLIHLSHSRHCPGWQHWPQGGAGALGTWLGQHSCDVSVKSADFKGLGQKNTKCLIYNVYVNCMLKWYFGYTGLNKICYNLHNYILYSFYKCDLKKI